MSLPNEKPFWKSDWGIILKALFSLTVIAATGGIAYVFIKRNREMAPVRRENMEIAKKLIGYSEVFKEDYPDKIIATTISVSNDDTLSTEAVVFRDSRKDCFTEFML